MCYYVLKANGNVVSRTTVQRIENLDLEKETTKQKTARFNQEIWAMLETDNYTILGTAENA